MIFKSIKLTNFLSNKKPIIQKEKISQLLKSLIKNNNPILSSMNRNYKDSYTKQIIKDLKKTDSVNLIGMGGSSLGTKAIYNFLKSKKKFNFIDNISNYPFQQKGKKNVNLIISKSGNTLETISNANIIVDKRKKYFYNRK